MLNGLSLFSGIGGIDFALREWIRPIAYCEIDPFCQAVLLSRIANGDLGFAPIWDDINTLESSFLDRFVDIVFGGFPCQDISVAGNGKGLDGKRSGLFFEIVRVAKEIKPKFIFLENVPAITSRGGIQVVREIASLGYDCRWCVISAASVGAKHKRERWFLLAHAQSLGCRQGGLSIREKKGQSVSFDDIEYYKWHKEPENKLEMAGMVDGIQGRVDRIRALGNSVVPLQVRKAFQILSGIKRSQD